MPTYEYACKSCGNHFDAWQKITDEPLTECPTCHGAVRRVLYPAGVVFKGSGFYSTESRKNGASASAEKPAETTSEATTEAKSETKGEAPAAKSPTDTAKAS